MRIMANPNRGRGGTGRAGAPNVNGQAWANGHSVVNGNTRLLQNPTDSAQSTDRATLSPAPANNDDSKSAVTEQDQNSSRGSSRGGFRGAAARARGGPGQVPNHAFNAPRGSFIPGRGRGGFIPGGERSRGGFPGRGFRGRGRGGPPPQVQSSS